MPSAVDPATADRNGWPVTGACQAAKVQAPEAACGVVAVVVAAAVEDLAAVAAAVAVVVADSYVRKRCHHSTRTI